MIGSSTVVSFSIRALRVPSTLASVISSSRMCANHGCT